MNETLRGVFYRDRWSKYNCQTYRIFLSQGDYPLKGFHYLLQAMPKILEQFPDAEVYVAGANILKAETWKDVLKLPAYGKYLKKLIREHHLEEKVTMLGRLDAEEMKKQYLSCHVFVCPSALENSPNSVGEAMLLGVPCVAANVGGIHNILTDGGDGFLYPPGMWMRWRTALSRFLRRKRSWIACPTMPESTPASITMRIRIIIG